jgi:uncharacterized metal-binding protein YceD (DUF177 family)
MVPSAHSLSTELDRVVLGANLAASTASPSCAYRAEIVAEMGELRIPLHDLDTLGKDYVFALDGSWLDRAFQGSGVSGDVSLGNGEASVHAQRNGTEILVHGKARARLVAECVRCLKGVPVEVSCDLAALYAPGAPPNPSQVSEDEDLDIDPDEPDREFYTGDYLEIDELVRDYLLLELPMQPRCEPACISLPESTRSGDSNQGFGEKRIDPRLAPLQKLAMKREPTKE